ncbi:MAG: hypothetical protein IJA15_04710 [Clostridia bacterium]|nr:hypothetical protein [Clostridia bacterium]MBQ9709775.1 hypothetical protein [Clostridia bacterium]
MHKIRQELNQIRYYYSRRELFDKAFGCVGKSGIVDLVEKYNKAVCNAEPRLYEIYVSIYIEGCTQENAADQLGYSANYIYKMNRKLIAFFFSYFNKEEVA